MICLGCGHYRSPDREMARVQRSDDCPCRCHGRDKALGRYRAQEAVADDVPACRVYGCTATHLEASS